MLTLFHGNPMQSITDTEKFNFAMTYLIKVVQDGLRSD